MGGGAGPAAGASLRLQKRFKSRIQPVISLENFVRTGKRQANGQPAPWAGFESIPEERLAKALRTSVKAKRDVGD
ncbi:hypothetical protein BSZ19_38980 [Bradyrhizobium japonicum]|uniref:Uncharacterized protein n=1 Tax=Bradyrhizobium japonicum TaxID=375 RepID=A0A1Y2JCC3_BRAJP|nr:hypothetical protein BSZ19_38980 [Bradyrhizobium japonicum]